jgi:hypothetical protein
MRYLELIKRKFGTYGYKPRLENPELQVFSPDLLDQFFTQLDTSQTPELSKKITAFNEDEKLALDKSDNEILKMLLKQLIIFSYYLNGLQDSSRQEEKKQYSENLESLSKRFEKLYKIFCSIAGDFFNSESPNKILLDIFLSHFEKKGYSLTNPYSRARAAAETMASPHQSLQPACLAAAPAAAASTRPMYTQDLIKEIFRDFGILVNTPSGRVLQKISPDLLDNFFLNPIKVIDTQELIKAYSELMAKNQAVLDYRDAKIIFVLLQYLIKSSYQENLNLASPKEVRMTTPVNVSQRIESISKSSHCEFVRRHIPAAEGGPHEFLEGEDYLQVADGKMSTALINELKVFINLKIMTALHDELFAPNGYNLSHPGQKAICSGEFQRYCKSEAVVLHHASRKSIIKYDVSVIGNISSRNLYHYGEADKNKREPLTAAQKKRESIIATISDMIETLKKNRLTSLFFSESIKYKISALTRLSELLNRSLKLPNMGGSVKDHITMMRSEFVLLDTTAHCKIEALFRTIIEMDEPNTDAAYSTAPCSPAS